MAKIKRTVGAPVRAFSDAQEQREVQEFCRERWKPGCLIGDLAREEPGEMSDDEVCMLLCAREGYLLASGQLISADSDAPVISLL